MRCAGIVLAAAHALSAAAEPVDLVSALADLRAAYAGSMTQERVEVAVRKSPAAGAAGGQTWREQYVVRIDPGSPRSTAGIGCRLELGELNVWWAAAGLSTSGGAAPGPDGTPPGAAAALRGATLIAVHDRDLASCYLARVEGALTPVKLDAALMPVPVPQVALAFAREQDLGVVMQGLTSYTPEITWESASRDERKPPGDVVIIGRVNGTAVPTGGPGSATRPAKATLVSDFRTGRLKRFTAEIDEGRLELDLRVKGETALDRVEWAIAPLGRVVVKELAALGPRPGDAAASRIVPDMLLQTVQGRAWSVRESLRPAASPSAPAPAGGDRRLVLLFVREQTPRDATAPAGPAEPAGGKGREFENADARAGWAAAVAVLKDRAAKEGAPGAGADRAGASLVQSQVVLVAIQPDDKVREKIAAAAKTWGDALVWSASPAGTIDRFAPGAAAVLIVVGEPDVLCGMVRLDGRGAETGAIEAELRRALDCKGPAAAAPPQRGR